MPSNSYPIKLAQTLQWKVRNFTESTYDFSPGSNLYTLMSTILGDSGVGQLNAVQVVARITQQYMQFSDLETILGSLLNTPRLVSELYSTNVNPFTDQLTLTQWQDILSKDSSYRERLMGVTFALLRGATVQGLQSIAESTAQIKFQVIENWTSASIVASGQNWSRNLDGGELIFVPIVPSGLDFTLEEQKATILALEQLKPAGTIITVVTGSLNNFNTINYVVSGSSSEYFYFDRQVTANNISIPSYVVNSTDPTTTSRYWLKNNQSVSAPYFAFTQTQEESIDLTANIGVVTVNSIITTSVGNSTGSPTQTTAPLKVPSLTLGTIVTGI